VNLVFTITITRFQAVMAGLVVLAVTVLVAVSGCSQKFLEPFRDAPTAGHDGSSSRVTTGEWTP